MNTTDNKVRKLISPRKMTSITLGLLLLCLIGVFQFISLKCSLDTLKTSDFWLKMLYRAILVFLAYSATLDFLYDRNFNSTKMEEARETLDKLSKMRGESFSSFLDKKNRENKIQEYKDGILRKIGALEKKAAKPMYGKSRQRKLDYINQTIKELKASITDEFIEEHIDTLKVKYDKIYESDFNSLEMLEGKKLQNKLTPDYGRVRTKATFKKIVPFLFTSVVLGMAVAASVQKPALDVLLNLLSDAILVVMRVAHGAYDSAALMEEAYMIPYQNRIRILKEYINWDTNPESKASRILKIMEEQAAEKTA